MSELYWNSKLLLGQSYTELFVSKVLLEPLSELYWNSSNRSYIGTIDTLNRGIVVPFRVISELYLDLLSELHWNEIQWYQHMSYTGTQLLLTDGGTLWNYTKHPTLNGI